jgi:hypothetical protein
MPKRKREAQKKSARDIMELRKTEEKTMNTANEQVFQSLRFTQADLDANRQGLLSQRQAKKEEELLLRGVFLTSLVCFIPLAIFSDLAFRMIPEDPSPDAYLLLLFFGALLSLAAGYWLWRYYRLRKGNIEAIEGTVSFLEHRAYFHRGYGGKTLALWSILKPQGSYGKTPKSCFLQVDNRYTGESIYVRVEGQLNMMSKKGSLWRLYYNPQNANFLSIEPIEAEEKPKRDGSL